MKKPSSRSYTIYFIVLGFIFGLVLVVFGTMVALVFDQQPLTVSNMLQAHLTTPLLWVLDSVPFLLAAILGVLGSREAKLSRLQQEGRDVQRRALDTARMNVELAKKEKEYQDIEAIISRGKREWEATFDSVPDIIMLADDQEKIIRCNRAATQAFHQDFPQIIGRPLNTLFFGSEAFEPMPAQKTEIKFPTLDGWYEVSSTALTFEGVPHGKIFVVRNITDRKQAALDLERQKQFYEALVKNSPIAILTLSLEHRVVACNPAFEEMFGYSQLEVLGQYIDNLISPLELLEESQSLTQIVGRGQEVHKLSQRRRKDGSLVDVELFGIPVVLWGKQIGILEMYHDISDLVQARLQTGPELAQEPLPQRAETAPVVPFFGVMEAEPQEAVEPEDEALAAGAQEIPLPQVEPLETGAPEITFEDVETLDAAPGEVKLGEVEGFVPEPPPGADEEPAADTQEVMVPAEQAEQAAQAADTGEQAVRSRRRLIKIETIEGIGAAYAAKLGALGIDTTEDLLKVGATRKGRQDLAKTAEISDKLVLKWVNRADLMRVPGIGEEYSDLLEAAGVDTVKELRNRNANNLYKALSQINEEKKLVRRVPRLSEVEGWVRAAKELEARVSY